MPYPYGLRIETDKKYYEKGESVAVFAQPLGAWITPSVPFILTIKDDSGKFVTSEQFSGPNDPGHVGVNWTVPGNLFPETQDHVFLAYVDYDGSEERVVFSHY